MAEDGEQALQRLAAEPFDLMILDIMMPVKDGWQVLQELPPATRERMPILVLTAKAEDGDVLKGYAVGASYYVIKPFDNVTLLNAILFLLGELSEDDMDRLELKL